MSSSPNMIVKSRTYNYHTGVNSFLAGLATIGGPFAMIAPLVLTNTLPEMAFLALAGTATGLPWLSKLISGADAKRADAVLADLPLQQAGPTFREKRELLSQDKTTGKEVYLVRNLNKAVIEIHTPENPGKTWDRVYESILKVHDLKEVDFLVYAESADNSGSSHGKLLPWKHSINKAMAFTGYGIVCDCKSCTR